jgi:hypothetical protein
MVRKSANKEDSFNQNLMGIEPKSDIPRLVLLLFFLVRNEVLVTTLTNVLC